MEKDYYEGESTGNKLVTLSYTTLNENSDDHKPSDNDYSYTFSVKDGQTWYSVVRATQHMLINMGYRFGDDIDFVELLDEAIQNNLDLYVNNKNWCFLRPGILGGVRKLGGNNIKLNCDRMNNISTREIPLKIWYLTHYLGSLFPTLQQVETCLNHNFKKISSKCKCRYFI